MPTIWLYDHNLAQAGRTPITSLWAIVVVRTDVGYFTYPILNSIREVLRAGFMIDYNT